MGKFRYVLMLEVEAPSWDEALDEVKDALESAILEPREVGHLELLEGIEWQ